MDGKKKALIVDDDQNSRLIFQKYLTSIGFETVMANNGDEALELLARGPLIDLIITDVMMPYMTGFDLTKKLKEYADTRTIPIIGTSAFHDWHRERAENEFRVDAFIPKPVDRNVFIATIKKVMEK